MAFLTQRRLIGLAVLLLSASGLHAQVTYCYTGNNFTLALAPYTTSDSISGCLTVSSPLPPDGDTWFSYGITFEFTDGLFFVTQNDPALFAYGFHFITAGGIIVFWDLEIYETCPPACTSGGSIMSSGPGGYGYYDAADSTSWYPSSGSYEVYALNIDNAGVWSNYSGTIGNGIDISRSAGSVPDDVWQEMLNTGIHFVAVQAWGGRTCDGKKCRVYAEKQLIGAQRKGLATAAYVLLNYDDPNQDGAYQVGQALAAIGSGLAGLKFLAIDVEPICIMIHKKEICEDLPPLEYAARIARIREAVETASMKTRVVIYTDRGGWARITSSCRPGKKCLGCSRNPANDCSDLVNLPLWDTEHVPCGDGIIGLAPFSPYPGNSGWLGRLGNQYDTGPGPGCNGTSLFGIPVDLDFFDPSLFR